MAKHTSGSHVVMGPVTALGQVTYVATSRLAFSINNDINMAHREKERDEADYNSIRDMLGLSTARTPKWDDNLPGTTIPLKPERLKLYREDMVVQLGKVLDKPGEAWEGVAWNVLRFMGVVSGNYADNKMPVVAFKAKLTEYVAKWNPDLEVATGAGRCWVWAEFGPDTVGLPFVDVSGLSTQDLALLTAGSNLDSGYKQKPLTMQQWAAIIRPRLNEWTDATKAKQGIELSLPKLGIYGANVPSSQVRRGFALAKLMDVVPGADIALVQRTLSPEQISGELIKAVHGEGKDSGFKAATPEGAKAFYANIVKQAEDKERAITAKRAMTPEEAGNVKKAESTIAAFAKRARDIANMSLGNIDGTACLQMASAELLGDDASKAANVLANKVTLAKYTLDVPVVPSPEPPVVPSPEPPVVPSPEPPIVSEKQSAKAPKGKPVNTAGRRAKAGK